jgi:hypothetical protein
MAQPDAAFGQPCRSEAQVTLRVDLGASGVFPTVTWASGNAAALLRVAARIRAWNLQHPGQAYSVPAGQFQTYNCRAITGGTDWSLHAWPVAVDINPADNPYVADGTARPHTIPQYFVDAFLAEGFRWGGNWTRPKDYMHFENRNWLGAWDGTYPDHQEFMAPAPQAGGPSISGPSSVDRGGPPPSFETHPGANLFFGVELVTDPALFLDDQATNRTDATYYASWVSEGMHSSNPYFLPDGAWQQLRWAPRIWYRVWTSTSADDWLNSEVSTPNESVGGAPSLVVVGEADAPTSTLPWISGPASADRSGSAPEFDIDPGSNSFHGVELTTDPALFSDDQNDQRQSGTYYASWVTEGLLAENPYVLPDDAWQALNWASQIWYRVWTSSSSSEWIDMQVSTSDADADSAPSIEIVG